MPVATLRKVRVFLQHNWMKGLPVDLAGSILNYRDWPKDGCRCLGIAVLEQSDTQATAKACFKALGFSNCVEVGVWNDKPERSLADVLERLDHAIEGLSKSEDH